MSHTNIYLEYEICEAELYWNPDIYNISAIPQEPKIQAVLGLGTEQLHQEVLHFSVCCENDNTQLAHTLFRITQKSMQCQQIQAYWVSECVCE